MDQCRCSTGARSVREPSVTKDNINRMLSYALAYTLYMYYIVCGGDEPAGQRFLSQTYQLYHALLTIRIHFLSSTEV